MEKQDFGPELQREKLAVTNNFLDPGWRWMRWMYYDDVISGLGFYDGKPVFYLWQEVMSEDEEAARGYSKYDRTLVIYEATDKDLAHAKEQHRIWQEAQDKFLAENPNFDHSFTPPHSEESVKRRDEHQERLIKNKVLGWLRW